MSNHDIIDGKNVPIYAWRKGVEFDDNTVRQLSNIAALPIAHHHVAAMPDAHVGIGATVGSVIATKGAVIPAAVGVDIGCGMAAVKLSINIDDLPDHHAIRCAIEAAVPHGRTDNGGKNDRGTFVTPSPSGAARWRRLKERYDDLCEDHPKMRSHKTAEFVGTLGTGNHFIEICADAAGAVWVMLHSGSRGLGNKIGSYFIAEAKREMERWGLTDTLPDSDCSYLVEHTEIFDDYVRAVELAQEFAEENRKEMMSATLKALRGVAGMPAFSVTDTAINCHHNYISREFHFGEETIVTRKGAVSAWKGQLGIIPGSMGTGSFIVRGLGNEQSFCSCSHGAGRRMSRGEAKKKISLEMHCAAVEGIECRRDEDVLDESPAAYKDLFAVMAAQDDLVEIVARLTTVINVKG
jgi:tRNA-splicing ligase RtcB